jgi:hypothetical protein
MHARVGPPSSVLGQRQHVADRSEFLAKVGLRGFRSAGHGRCFSSRVLVSLNHVFRVFVLQPEVVNGLRRAAIRPRIDGEAAAPAHVPRKQPVRTSTASSPLTGETPQASRNSIRFCSPSAWKRASVYGR